jgi:hypothetical protein
MMKLTNARLALSNSHQLSHHVHVMRSLTRHIKVKKNIAQKTESGDKDTFIY